MHNGDGCYGRPFLLTPMQFLAYEVRFKSTGLPLPVISKSSICFDNLATMNHFYHDIYVFETKIDTRCRIINYIDYIRKNINLYIKVWVIFGTRSTNRGKRFQSNIVQKF